MEHISLNQDRLKDGTTVQWYHVNTKHVGISGSDGIYGGGYDKDDKPQPTAEWYLAYRSWSNWYTIQRLCKAEGYSFIGNGNFLFATNKSMKNEAEVNFILSMYDVTSDSFLAIQESDREEFVAAANAAAEQIRQISGVRKIKFRILTCRYGKDEGVPPSNVITAIKEMGCDYIVSYFH